MCWDDFITSDKSIPSRSGLYATGLPGVTLSLFDDLTKDEQEDYLECWADLYTIAQQNFVSDVQGKLSGKFHFDQKLITRETSSFNGTENTSSGLAGLTLEFSLPKYARLQILTIEVFSLVAYGSPEFEINIYDTDASGELLYTKSTELTIGRNVIGIYQDFEVDKLFVTYSATDYQLQQTENRFYASCTYWDFSKLSCSFPCWGNTYNATVTQENGGGLNAKFVIYCSIEKFICENINLFKIAFQHRIGIDLMRERILSDRFTRFTTLTKDRAEELMKYYRDEYDIHLTNCTTDLKIQEDDICFTCKSTVSTSILLP